MLNIKTTSILFLSLLLIACNGYEKSETNNESPETSSAGYSNQKESDGIYDLEMNKSASSSNGNATKINHSIATKRKMIWRSSIEFQVENVEISTEKIKDICKKESAFLSGMNLTSNNYRISNNMEIRVQNENFNSLLKKLKGESIFIDKMEVTSNDVTEEFVDIESRLKTKKEVRTRYVNILRNKTGSIKDVIAAEEAIRVITEEIEAKEGRLRYLKDQVSFSTITLSIYQKVEFKRAPDVYKKSFGDKMADSFGSGWKVMTIIFLRVITLWPLLIILTIVFLFWKRRKRKK